MNISDCCRSRKSRNTCYIIYVQNGYVRILMSFSAVKTNSSRVGTCPHGLPLGACPICNGMSGGGAKKADFSAKPGEMSWNQCAAIGAFLKAQKMAQQAREQDAVSFAQKAQAFQNALMNSSQKIANIAQFFTQNTPAIIAKPMNFVLNTVLGNGVKMIANVVNFVQNFAQKMADISDKLTAMMGELKASIEKKISESFKDLKKKIKSIFAIFKPLDADDEEKQIDETKKAFELRTFIHDLYKKLTGDNNGD